MTVSSCEWRELLSFGIAQSSNSHAQPVSRPLGPRVANPVLKKLRSPGISSERAAGLLEQHIGSDANEERCLEALAAVRRMKDPRFSSAPRVICLLLPNAAPRELIRAVICQLRGGH